MAKKKAAKKRTTTSFGRTKTDFSEKLPQMPDDRMTRLMALMRVQSNAENENQMVSFIGKELTSMGVDFFCDNAGNIIAIKGKADVYPCVVAHMDTVHDIVDGYNIYREERDNQTIWFAAINGKTNTGIGGDDKSGIFVALDALETFDNIKAIFFTSEEIGCVGSSDIDLKLLDDVGYVLQADRWGRSDFIDVSSGSDTTSDGFKKLVSPLLEVYGYKSTSGLITDSITLFNRGVGVSCVNISCGYYEPHTSTEFISLEELWNCRNLVVDMIKSLGCNKYEQEKEHCSSAYDYDDWDSWRRWDHDKPAGKYMWSMHCDVCNTKTKCRWDVSAQGYVCEDCDNTTNKPLCGYCGENVAVVEATYFGVDYHLCIDCYNGSDAEEEDIPVECDFCGKVKETIQFENDNICEDCIKYVGYKYTCEICGKKTPSVYVKDKKYYCNSCYKVTDMCEVCKTRKAVYHTVNGNDTGKNMCVTCFSEKSTPAVKTKAVDVLALSKKDDFVIGKDDYDLEASRYNKFFPNGYLNKPYKQTCEYDYNKQAALMLGVPMVKRNELLDHVYQLGFTKYSFTCDNFVDFCMFWGIDPYEMLNKKDKWIEYIKLYLSNE